MTKLKSAGNRLAAAHFRQVRPVLPHRSVLSRWRAVSGCMRIMRRGVVSLVLCVSICLNTFYLSFLKVRSICVFQACATSLAGQTNFFCKNPRFDPSVDQAGQGAVAHTYGPLRPSLRRGKGLPVDCEKFLRKYAGLPYEWQGSYSNGVFLSMQIHVVAV